MTKDEVIDMNLAELIELNLIPKAHVGFIRKRFEWVYVAAWEEGKRSQYEKRKPVIKFDLSGTRIAEYPSATIAANKHKITKHTISKACLGKIKTAAGYIWRYKNE